MVAFLKAGMTEQKWIDDYFERDCRAVMLNAGEFIGKYEKYYFKETYVKNDLLGIKRIRTTRQRDEKNIVEKLRTGTHDQYILAWKLGSFRSEDNVFPEKIRGFYGSYDMSNYLTQISKKENEIIDPIHKALDCLNDERNWLDAVKELSKAFDIIKSCNTESAFGTVYMINSMFFLSKGEIPIYDKNVFKAVQALYLNRNPKDIIASDAPSAKDSMGAMFRLIEYMYLLEKVFGEGKKERSKDYLDGEHVGYLSRGLDRALWVYGQCTKIYDGR